MNDTPELYVYLLVRPNCSQRLAALVDQANSGRGLSDIAVYRDSTPAGDDEVPHGEDRVLAISPDVAVNEFFEDYDEEDSNEEQEAVENQEQETVENQEQDALEDRQQEVVETQEEDLSNYQLARDRTRTEIRIPARFDEADIIAYALNIVEKSEAEPKTYQEAINCKESQK